MDLHCSVTRCGKPATGSLGSDAFCREHFMLTCYGLIESFSQQLADREHWSEASTEELAHSLNQITDQAVQLGLGAQDLSNLERAQLMDILMWVADVRARLRRSSRKRVSVAVRLLSERPGRVWEEETTTRAVSRYGALLESRNPVEVGQELILVRVDTRQQAQARVAWCGFRKQGRQELAIEILGSDNFWGMEW